MCRKIRFGMRYVDAITTEEDGTLVADLSKIGEMEPDVGEHLEQGWREREDVTE